MYKLLLFGIFLLLISSSINAQDKPYEFYGNFRIAHIGSDTEADGIEISLLLLKTVKF